jgi:hypothetical protein
VHATTANGDSFSFTFNGSGIAYIAEEGAYYGNVDVYLDGVFKQTVGSYVAGAANTSPQVIYRVNGLSAGQHTLKVAKRDGTWMTIDALTVQP